jgi:hypothetical protein
MTIHLDPTQDISGGWGTTTGSSYYTEIDEINGDEANVDTNDYISSSPDVGTREELSLGLEAATVGDPGTYLTVHAHGWTGSAGQCLADVSIDGGSTWLGEGTLIGPASSEGWYTLQWTGLTVDQTALDNLVVKLAGYLPMGGGYIEVSAVYVSTDAVADSGGGGDGGLTLNLTDLGWPIQRDPSTFDPLLGDPATERKGF